MPRFKHSLQVLVAALALSALSCAQAKPAAQPQPAQQPARQPASDADQNSASRSADRANTTQDLVHASDEAAGRPTEPVKEHGAVEQEDEEAAFKFNPFVQWTAKKTGLSVSAAYWLYVFINFAIIAFFIIKFMRSGLPAAFRKRTEDIRKGIEDAQRTSEDAHRRLTAIESRLSHLDTEINEMRARADLEAREEEARIAASAEEEKRKIVEGAEREIEQASSQAKRELQRYAAQLAIDQAERQLQVTPQDDQTLVRDFAAQLPTGGNS